MFPGVRSPLTVAVVLVLLGGLTAASDRAPSSFEGVSVQEFLSRHWRRPIAPQGVPLARFAPLEASLAPQSCGTCHPAQLSDWRTAHHAKSMGPGVTGQLAELWRTDAESARLCLTCHAPLAEQQPENRAIFDAALHGQGVVCAACHVREHQRFGPPRRERTVHSSAPQASLPHGGATRTPAFMAAEFCSSCHQFENDGFALNGKLLENTYEEWKASPAASRGPQCQDCHMPDRRHLWRGIHDPEMVRSGVTVNVVTDRPRYRRGDQIAARITLTATGVGHHFPTYVTPRVVVRAVLVESGGREAPGSAVERVIARDVSLDLSRELFDTRVPAGRQFVFDYRRRVELVGLSLRVLVTVHPDHFYTRFFESLLVSGSARIGAKPRSKMRSTPHAGRCSNSTAATCLSPDRQGDAMTRTLRVLVIVALCSTAANIQPTPATAQDGRITVKSTAPFERVAEALERAVTEEKMGLVCHANAQRAAAGRGVTIKGNQVLMVFRNDFAVRLLAADPAAGFEAPIRIYVFENGDGTATVSYLAPSAVFAPYRHPEVQAVARELDPIFKAIVDRGVAVR